MKQPESRITTSALLLSVCAIVSCHAADQQVATKTAEFNEQKEISSLDFSPDTHSLATVEWTGSEVHIWKWEKEPLIEKRLSFTEGAALFTLQGGLQYSPDNTLLAMVQTARRDDPSVVKIWDTNSGSFHAIGEAGRRGLKSGIAFSTDGKFLIRSYDASNSASDDQLFVYDTKTWNLAWSLRTAPFIPKVMSLSPNGKFIALGGMTTSPLF
jgi:WD40 repeat protein